MNYEVDIALIFIYIAVAVTGAIILHIDGRIKYLEKKDEDSNKNNKI